MRESLVPFPLSKGALGAHMEGCTIEALSRRLERLERANRRWRWGAMFAALAIAGAVVWAVLTHQGAAAAAEQAADAREDPLTTVKLRLELARKALAIIRAKTALGPQVSHPVEDTYRWSVLQLGAQIYLSMGPDEIKVEDPEVYLAVAKSRPNAERLKAFESHYLLMKKWEEKLRPLAQNTLIAPLDFMEIQEHRLQAELWLARERANVRAREERK
jgi:hypothetical protein